MSILSNRAFVLAAALIAGSTGVAAAPAFAADDVRTVTVDYKDLNLATPAGQKTLDRRISRASDAVCAQDGTDLATTVTVRSCRIAAQARARTEIAKTGVPAA